MAIFHLTAKVVSRGKGQSVIAAAAYRSGQELTDEQTGEVKSYQARAERIQFEGVFAPSNAPEWARDRQQLWNEVERFEKRKDAQLAREIEVALPHEMTDQQREWLIKDFVREQFTRKGYAVDVAIHAPDRDADERNFHAHLLVTMRTLDRDGFAERKDRSQNSTEQLKEWREDWAQLVNRHLERHGIAERIDHRSLEAQGIDREPTIHVGYAAAQMLARGAQSDRVDELRGILERNDAIRVPPEQGRDLPTAEPAPAPTRDIRSEEPAKAGAGKAAPEIFDSSTRPFDLAPETAREKESRELREKQNEARAELKAWQKAQRDELRAEIAKEVEAFRKQSRGTYSKAAEKAFGAFKDKFKADWEQLYTDAREGKLDQPRYKADGKTAPAGLWRANAAGFDGSRKAGQLAEAKVALAAQHRAALKERREKLFEKVRDIREVSWEGLRDVHRAARHALREEHKAQWQQLQGEHFNEWRDMSVRREKEFAARRSPEHAPAPLAGGMAAMQLKVTRGLAARAMRKTQAEQATLDRFANPAHARKEQLANMAALGKQETKAKAEITAPPRPDSPNKVEAATAQRLQSGKAFTAAFQEFLAKQADKPRNEGNVSERGRDKDRDDRGRERGGRGGRER